MIAARPTAPNPVPGRIAVKGERMTMDLDTKPRPAGRLFVVATPIGNRLDLSARAIATLQAVATVACEDTRHSAPLLAAIGSRARLVALHDHLPLQLAYERSDPVRAQQRADAAAHGRGPGDHRLPAGLRLPL